MVRLLAFLLVLLVGLGSAQDLNKIRAGHVRKMDARASLDRLVKALRGIEDPEVQEALLQGMVLGMEGQRDVPAPRGWRLLNQKLEQSASGEVTKLLQQLSQTFGDKAAIQQAVATLESKTAVLADRAAALDSLVAQQRREVIPLLPALLNEPGLQWAAIRAYGAFRIDRAADKLLGLYPGLDASGRQVVIETLATRRDSAEALLKALDAGTVARTDVPAYVSRSLSAMLGKRFSEPYGVKPLAGDKEAEIARIKAMATPDALLDADPVAGRLAFQKVCVACHQMYGEGGIIGPDLTGSNRADLDYLLLNILDPSGDIADAYKMVSITTRDGQVLAGAVLDEDGQKLILNMVGQQRVVAKSDIVKREISAVSMMPEGLLQVLQPNEVLDLIRYFQTSEQVELP